MTSNNHNIQGKVRRLGRKTRKVLSYFENEDYIYSVAKDLRMSHNGVKYHVQKLEEMELVQETEQVEERQYYKATDEGEIVLDRVNIPE